MRSRTALDELIRLVPGNSQGCARVMAVGGTRIELVRVRVVDAMYSPAYSPPVGPDGCAPPSFACRAKALLLDDGPLVRNNTHWVNGRTMSAIVSRSECPDLNRGSVLPKHVSYQARRHSDSWDGR